MLYFLLIIIAVGVLLLSPEGRVLLGSVHSLLVWVLGWGVFLAVIALLAGVLSVPSIHEVVYGKIGAFVFVPLYAYIIYRLYLGYRAGRQTRITFIVWSIVLLALIAGCLSVFWQ